MRSRFKIQDQVKRKHKYKHALAFLQTQIFLRKQTKMKIGFHFFLSFLLLFISYSSARKDNYVVGGTEVEKGRYNYTVALTMYGDHRDQFCGGVLIAPDYVLSAAHCGGYNPRILIGRHDLSNHSESFEEIEIDYEVIHPGYDCRTNENDVMIIKLAKNSSYTPIAYNIETDENIFVGEIATALGWGEINDQGDDTDLLLETEVEIKSNSECEDMVSIDSLNNPTAIISSFICGYEENEGVCNGDSGGPLIIKGNTVDSDLLIGITSFGVGGCGNPDYPDVYIRISSFVDFIRCVTGGGSDICGNLSRVGGLAFFYTIVVGTLQSIVQSTHRNAFLRTFPSE